MRKRLSIWALGLMLSTATYALELEEDMYLTQHWVSYTSSFDISTKDKKLGTLYKRVLSPTASYDFYDNDNNLVTTASSHFFSFGAHLNIYDNNERELGTVDERLFSILSTFDIYSPESTLLSRATMNFWGTTFTLYDGKSSRILGTISRPFFSLKNDWAIHITDIDRVKEKNIDPRLLLTVLAIQSDFEDMTSTFFKIHHKPRQLSAQAELSSTHRPHLGISIDDHIAAIIEHEQLSNVALMNEQDLETFAQRLEQEYLLQGKDIQTNTKARVLDFINYCLALASSNETTKDQKKAITTLLIRTATDNPHRTATVRERIKHYYLFII